MINNSMSADFFYTEQYILIKSIFDITHTHKLCPQFLKVLDSSLVGREGRVLGNTQVPHRMKIRPD